MEKNKDKERWSGEMEAFMKVNGKMEKSMVKENTPNLDNKVFNKNGNKA